MSYEVSSIKKIDCLCGKGVIKKVTKMNDWNQEKETIEVICENCNNTYEVVSEYYCSKPKHEYTKYYLKNKYNNEKIQVDL